MAPGIVPGVLHCLPERSAGGQAERPRQPSGAQERVQGLVHRLARGPVVHVAGSAGLAGIEDKSRCRSYRDSDAVPSIRHICH